MSASMVIDALPEVHAMGGALQLDMTAVLAFVVFLVAMLFLKYALINPYVEIVEERDRRTTGALEGVDDMVAQAQKTLLEYEAKMAVARKEANTLREGLRAKGESHRDVALSAAHQKADHALDQRRSEIAASMAVAEKSVEKEAKSLSQAIVSRVLDTGV